MVNFGLYHLLDRSKTVNFNAAMTCLLQQPWVVFTCQTQATADRQLKVSTLQFATAEGEVYIFDCLALGSQAIHECGLAWLLQTPSIRKVMFSSDNTAAALWRQLKVQIAGAMDLQALTATPQHWPSLPPGSDRSLTDAISECDSLAGSPTTCLPLPILSKSPKPPSCIPPAGNLHIPCPASVNASSQKSSSRGHESPQAVLDLMLDDLESDALSSPHNLVYQFTRDSPNTPKSEDLWPPRQQRGRCSSIGSMSLLDSMQLMELPILPEEDGSVADEFLDNKMDEGGRFDWLHRPLSSDALDYAAAEAKTILRLYQQVAKDNKYAASIVDSQTSSQFPGDVGGPASPYRQQQIERRRVLSEGRDGKACPPPVSAKKSVGGGSPGSNAGKSKKNKIPSWRMPCLS